MKKLNLKYVTELVNDDYLNWKSGDVIKISSPTGTGKNYFLFHVLLQSLKSNEKMLYLCNRKALKNETKIDLYNLQGIQIPKKQGEIDFNKVIGEGRIGKVIVRSYQGIEEQIHANKYNSDNELTFDDYKYVICDEFHYVLADSFNGMTDLTFTRLMQVDNTIKVFMSATMQTFDNPIKELANRSGRLFSYSQASDYSYVSVKAFKWLKDMALTIKNDKSNHKWVIFVYSEKQANDYISLIGESDCLFVKSGSSEINEIIANKTFTQKVLISTCVLDNGINLKDEEIRNIVIMESHYTKFIQMLGRLRFTQKENEIYSNEINLYIPKLSVKNFENSHQKAQEDLSMIELYTKDIDAFYKKYDRKINRLSKSLFFNFKGKANHINSVGYWDLVEKASFYQQCIDGLNEDEFYMLDLRCQWLGKDCGDYEFIENVYDDVEVLSLQQYLNGLIGKRLYKAEQKELIDKINHRVDYKQVKSYKGLNLGLELINLPFVIIPKKSNDFRFWIIEKFCL